LVFLAAGTMAFSVMAFARVRGSVKRRTSHILDESERQANPKRSLRYSSLKEEHRAGFPDFRDLLVVCADSGLSMEAALERVGRELGDSYPSLSTNIHMTNLETRAGRPPQDALEGFADRLGLSEAHAFATLINQSIDLGSSITDALRVYSDDMRHKRLSRAEE